jgi:hypothetical protein
MAEDYKPGIQYGPNNRAQVDWDRYQSGTDSSLDFSQGGIQGNMAKDAGWWNPWDMDLQYDENGKPYFEGSFGGKREYIDEQYFKDDPESGSTGKETTRKEAFNAKQALKKASKFKVDPNEMSDWGKIGYMAAPHIGKIPGAIGKGALAVGKGALQGAGAVLGGAGAAGAWTYGGLKKGAGFAYDALTDAWNKHTAPDHSGNQEGYEAYLKSLEAKPSTLLRTDDDIYGNMSEDEKTKYNLTFGRQSQNGAVTGMNRTSNAISSNDIPSNEVLDEISNNTSTDPFIDPNWQPSNNQSSEEVDEVRTTNLTDQEEYEKLLAQQERIKARQANSNVNTSQTEAIDKANALNQNELANNLINLNDPNALTKYAPNKHPKEQFKTAVASNTEFNKAYEEYKSGGSNIEDASDELVAQLGIDVFSQWKMGELSQDDLNKLLEEKGGFGAGTGKYPFPLQKAGQDLNFWDKLKSKFK